MLLKSILFVRYNIFGSSLLDRHLCGPTRAASARRSMDDSTATSSDYVSDVANLADVETPSPATTPEHVPRKYAPLSPCNHHRVSKEKDLSNRFGSAPIQRDDEGSRHDKASMRLD